MNTQDLAEFGYREIKIATELLLKYCENFGILGGGVNLELNMTSGNVFLVDEDFRVVMLNGENGGVLEEWFSCPGCGHEGFLEDMPHISRNEDCQRYLEKIGAGLVKL